MAKREFKVEGFGDLHQIATDLLGEANDILKFEKTIAFLEDLTRFYWRKITSGRKRRVFERSIWRGNRIRVVIQ